jgi:hypothetical protein
MLKRCFKERCVLLGHLPSEIDDPLVSRTASKVLSIAPRAQHLGIPPAVGIRRQLKPRASQFARHVEGTALGIAHKRDATIFIEALRCGQVQITRSQISVDARRWAAVEPRDVISGTEADQRHPDARAVDDPWLVAPGFKDADLAGDPIEHAAIGSPRIELVATSPTRFVWPNWT